MNEHPIEKIMTTAMNSIQNMIDVNTIIGDPIETSNNVIIIPISKVSFGFAAGGSEFNGETLNEYRKEEKKEDIQYKLPFGGGSGAGVNINPIAFLIITKDNVKLIPINHSSTIDKLLDYMPDLIEKTNHIINKYVENKQEDTKKIINKITKQNKPKKENIQNDKDEIVEEFEYKDIPDEEDEILNE